MILVATLRETFLGRASRHLENLARRQQVAIPRRARRRPWRRTLDRLFWVIRSRLWPRNPLRRAPGPWPCGSGCAFPTTPQPQQQQLKRSIHVVPKPVNSVGYRQSMGSDSSVISAIPEYNGDKIAAFATSSNGHRSPDVVDRRLAGLAGWPRQRRVSSERLGVPRRARPVGNSAKKRGGSGKSVSVPMAAAVPASS